MELSFILVSVFLKGCYWGAETPQEQEGAFRKEGI
jgi:hypothetical protein